MPVAVVTGAGGGLGRAIARELGGRGFLGHVTALDPDAAARTAAEIGGGARSAALDVRDEAACRALAAEAAARGGTLDVWVNNAGVLYTGLSWEQEEATRRAMLEINALGTMNGTVAALEPMIAAGRGHVINVVSLAGIVAAPGEVSYSASKHAALPSPSARSSTCGARASMGSSSRPSAPMASGDADAGGQARRPRCRRLLLGVAAHRRAGREGDRQADRTAPSPADPAP